MINVFLLDVYNENFSTIDIEPDDLDALYEKLNCRCIDIVTRTIDGKQFDIVCDAEGPIHEPRKISAVDKNCKPVLVGNLIFAHHDAEGNLTGLEDGDMMTLLMNIGVIRTNDCPSGYFVMSNMDWR